MHGITRYQAAVGHVTLHSVLLVENRSKESYNYTDDTVSKDNLKRVLIFCLYKLIKNYYFNFFI